MTFRIVIEPRAREEMRKAGDWYETRESGVGARFAVVVDECLRQIASDPLRYPKAGATTRKAKIQRWPYSIYFTVLEDLRLIRVTAVWHGSQNPRRLARRVC